MHTSSLFPDPAELYVARLGTDHSRDTARSALRTIETTLGMSPIPWAQLTYADYAMLRARLGAYSVAWANTC